MKTPNRLRICSFIQYYFPIIGGTENQAKLLNEELVRRGHSVFVITSKVPGQPTNDDIGGVQVRRFCFPPLFWRPYGPSAVRFFSRSLRMAFFLWRRRKGTDVIHVHLLREPALVAAFVNRFLKKPIVVKVANSGMVGDVRYLCLLHLRPFFRRLIDELPHAVALNSEAAAEIAATFPATKVIHVLPNGVDHTRFLPRVQDHPQSRVCLIYCGRLASEKGLDTLLKAMIRLRSNLLVDQLLIAGDGPGRERLERLCAENDLEDRVRFLGRVDPETAYARASIYVSASRAEGMPNAVLEAMAAGLVPVCSNIPGHQELILPGITGFLFDTGDDAALATYVERLAGEEQLRKTLAVNARRRIESGFSISAVAARYEALYASLWEPGVEP